MHIKYAEEAQKNRLTKSCLQIYYSIKSIADAASTFGVFAGKLSIRRLHCPLSFTAFQGGACLA